MWRHWEKAHPSDLACGGQYGASHERCPERYEPHRRRQEVWVAASQGWETLRLGRPLFIWNAIMNNSSLSWPKLMLKYGAVELTNPEEVLDILPSHKGILELAL